MYLKVTLLEDFILGPAVDWGTAGQVAYWKIIEESKTGYRVKRHGSKTFVFRDSVEAGESKIEPNFSYPTGLHLGLELVEKKPKLPRLIRLLSKLRTPSLSLASKPEQLEEWKGEK